MEPDNLGFISVNIAKCRDSVSKCLADSGRSEGDVTIIGVSKHFPSDYAVAAVKGGLLDLGENRVSEMLEKKKVLDSIGLRPNWHMIGSLQRKKVRSLLGNTYMIHSVDSLKLINEISECSVEKYSVTPVLIEVNTSGEASKHGFSPDEFMDSIEGFSEYKGIQVCGLMTMAPFTNDEFVLNEVFYKTRELFEKVKSSNCSPSFNILSMGMSNDYKIAIKHGATHIRLGTAIFGERTY